MFGGVILKRRKLRAGFSGYNNRGLSYIFIRPNKELCRNEKQTMKIVVTRSWRATSKRLITNMLQSGHAFTVICSNPENCYLNMPSTKQRSYGL
jgi:hypothetical protein